MSSNSISNFFCSVMLIFRETTETIGDYRDCKRL